jgi:putative hemolysin
MSMLSEQRVVAREHETAGYRLRFARGPGDVAAAQRLRYEVFNLV